MNVTECEGMVFASHGQRVRAFTEHLESSPFRLCGSPVPMVSTARYLGLVYGPGAPFESCRAQLNDSGRAAMFGLMNKQSKLRIWAPAVRMRLFDGQVRPIVWYGCEVWGPEVLSALVRGPRRRDTSNTEAGWFEACLDDPAVKLQVMFMRTTCGAKLPPHRLLFAELSQLPLHMYWLKMVIGFWNRLVRQPESLAADVLVEEVRLYLEGWNDGWVGHLFGVLGALGIDVWAGAPSLCLAPTSLATWRGATALPLAHICTAFREKLSAAAWSSPRLVENPRDCVSDGKQPGVKMCRYKHWMGGVALGAAAASWLPHVKALLPRRRTLPLPAQRRLCISVTAGPGAQLLRQQFRQARERCGVVRQRHQLLLLLLCLLLSNSRRLLLGIPTNTSS